MSQIPNAQCSTAALRVFKTPELLELVLVEVAEEEVNLTSHCSWKPMDPRVFQGPVRTFCYLEEPQFAFSPITLQRVNNDFKATIECSSKLRKLSLKALPSRVSPYQHLPILGCDHFGPLYWLESQAGLDVISSSKVQDGILHVRAKISGEYQHGRYELRKDTHGSWRKLPCTSYAETASKVVLHLETSAHYRIDRWTPDLVSRFDHLHLRTCDLGPEPKLGLLFDIIDAAEVSMGIDEGDD